MDTLVEAARARGQPRDLAIFLLLRFTGMRRGTVAGLRVRHLDDEWGLRGVRVKGGKTQDIPLPAIVMRFLQTYVQRVLAPLFWSTWGRRVVGKTRAPMTGKNIWRLCKTYGRLIGHPTIKPHDLRHGVAVEVLQQRHDLEEVRALLGHTRIDTTQIYTQIRPPQLKRPRWTPESRPVVDGSKPASEGSAPSPRVVVPHEHVRPQGFERGCRGGAVRRARQLSSAAGAGGS
jgi:site-specific recombinase XerD